MKSFVVLLSAGLDSTVNFLEARQEGFIRLALTFDYGQRSAQREIEKAKNICLRYQVPHEVVVLPFFKNFTKTSLVDQKQEVPVAQEVNIHSHSESLKTAERVWIPNRNGIFLNIAAGYAEGLGAQFVVPGFNFEEAATFPDNSEDFQKVLDQSFSYSTQSHVKVRCYTIHQTKVDILKRGLELGLEIDNLWPCYFGYEKWCGECESCLRFENALKGVRS